MLEISRRCDAIPFSKSHVRVDLPNRIGPTSTAKTAGLCSALRLAVESPAILRIVKIAHKPIVSVANWLPMLVHPLLDQIRPHLDWKTAATFGTNLLRTIQMENQAHISKMNAVIKSSEQVLVAITIFIASG